jgi:hypothetical protein
MKTKRLSGLVVLALAATGCGGASPTGDVAHLGTGKSASHAAGTSSAGTSSAGTSSAGTSSAGTSSKATSSLANQAVAYAGCMRTHGVPNFPDPKVSSRGNENSVKVAVPASEANNPHFQSAQQACRKLLPGGEPGSHPISPQEQAQYLRLAACIRSHGVPSFPDPRFSEGGVHLPKGSVNPRSPQVHAAEQACRLLIPASVRGGA